MEEPTMTTLQSPDIGPYSEIPAAAEYRLYRAAIGSAGLRLAEHPCARCFGLRSALERCTDYSLHGPDGVAIVCPSGHVIYSADDFSSAREAVADLDYALHDRDSRAAVLAALASGEAHVINRHSVSGDELRYVAPEELSFLDDPPDRGQWLCGTGFVAAR